MKYILSTILLFTFQSELSFEEVKKFTADEVQILEYCFENVETNEFCKNAISVIIGGEDGGVPSGDKMFGLYLNLNSIFPLNNHFLNKIWMPRNTPLTIFKTSFFTKYKTTVPIQISGNLSEVCPKSRLLIDRERLKVNLAIQNLVVLVYF